MLCRSPDVLANSGISRKPIPCLTGRGIRRAEAAPTFPLTHLKDNLD